MNSRSWIDHFIPARCLLCGAPAQTVPNLCQGCLEELPPAPAPACPRCAAPLPGGSLCGSCLRAPPAQSRTIAAVLYSGVSAHLIHRFKFLGDLAAGATLAALLARAVAHGAAPDLLVPVPLSPTRLRRRGFDQGLELARLVARRRRLTLDPRAVRRRGERPPQSSLATWSERRRNVLGVFHVEHERVAGCRVAVVDDVMTSGATVNALSRALLDAGAESIEAWIACRAVPRAWTARDGPA